MSRVLPGSFKCLVYFKKLGTKCKNQVISDKKNIKKHAQFEFLVVLNGTKMQSQQNASCLGVVENAKNLTNYRVVTHSKARVWKIFLSMKKKARIDAVSQKNLLSITC